jgi:hypothetical protein
LLWNHRFNVFLKEGYLRILEESGEDYLYPEAYFIPIQLPLEAQEALNITA